MVRLDISDSPVRVLHCIVALGGGGAERQLRNFLIQSDSDQVEHAVFAWKDGEFASEIRSCGVSVFLKPSRRSRPWHAIGGLTKVIQGWCPDLIQTWSPQFDVVAPLAARGSNVPVIGSERNSRFVYQNRAIYGKRWYSILRPLAFRFGVVAVCANSQAGAEYLLADLKVKVPVHTIPNGLDLDAIDAVMPATRESLRFPEDPSNPLIITASRLTQVKRVDLILSALTMLRERGIRPNLVVCGEGIERARLEAMTSELELTECVQFLGRRSDVVALIKTADIFCTASEGEGMPNSTLEAMACGVPVVASDIPPHRDLLEPDAVGKLFSSGSAEALAEGLRELLASGDRRRDLGLRGRALIMGFGILRMRKKYNDLYISYSGRRTIIESCHAASAQS